MSKTKSDRLFHLGYVSTETGDLGSAGMVELFTEVRLINTSRDNRAFTPPSDRFTKYLKAKTWSGRPSTASKRPTTRLSTSI